MSLAIRTNVTSLSAQNNLSMAQSTLSVSFNRLSSGYRINSAKDDAAGLAISDSMNQQVRSYGVAQRNANDAISMAQTAEGALGQVSSILSRMRELATEGASGSLQSSDRSYLQTEFSSLQAEITRIATTTKFNGQQLINSTSTAIKFQVGINNLSTDRITVTFGKVNLAVVTASSTLVSGTAGNSQSALDRIDSALSTVSTARARYGSVMNRMDISINNIATASLNLSAASSRIKDVDVAEESANLSRTQVLVQAGISILAQANSTPQTALSLLR